MLRHCLFLLGAATAAAQPAEFPAAVASGEVTQSSAVIWTRASSASVLDLEVSADPDFSSIVFKARREAEAAADFTVKADAFPLAPDTKYFYRWRSGTATSPAGRFRTAPAPDRSAAFKFVFAGDSDGTKQDGFPVYNNFEVLEAARKENPDFFIYLGDTIYADSEKRDAARRRRFRATAKHTA